MFDNFEIWFAGFIEAHGSFSSTGTFSFRGNEDILQALNTWDPNYNYNQNNKKRNQEQQQKIIDLCVPRLQGYKYYELAQFILKSPHFNNFNIWSDSDSDSEI